MPEYQLKIMHYLIEIGYQEPTRIYVVLKQPDGQLIMVPEYQADFSFEDLYQWYQMLQVKRPIIFVDEPIPPIREFFRSKGIRVR